MYGQGTKVAANDLGSSSYGQFRRDSSTANSNKRQGQKQPVGSNAKGGLNETVGAGFGLSTIGNYGIVKNAPLNPKVEKQLVKEAEMEFKRRGKFKRVFPSIDYHYYKQFFTEER